MLCSKLYRLKTKGGSLGFRDLKSFNMALIAKQGLHVLQKPNSLLVRVFKGKYFSNTSFLNVSQGKWASWSWQSIL